MSKQAEAGAIRIDKLERIEESQARKKGLEPSEIYPGMRVTAYAIGADGGHGLKKMTVLAKHTHTVLCETDNGLRYSPRYEELCLTK